METDMFKNGDFYTVRVRTDYGAIVAENFFSTRFDAEKAVALVEAATAKLTGSKPSATDKQIAYLAQAVTERLHNMR